MTITKVFQYKKDLFISICGKLNNVEMWNIKNRECILNIQNIYEDGAIYSACFLNDNNHNYIISSNCNNYGPSQPIKIFDINGNMVKK